MPTASIKCEDEARHVLDCVCVTTSALATPGLESQDCIEAAGLTETLQQVQETCHGGWQRMKDSLNPRGESDGEAGSASWRMAWDGLGPNRTETRFQPLRYVHARLFIPGSAKPQ